MPVKQRARLRKRWIAALAVLPIGAFAYRSFDQERLDPADLLPPDEQRAAEAQAVLAAASGAEEADPLEAAVQRGRELYETWQYDDARDALELALELDPDSAEAWYNLGLVELRQPGDILRSVAAFERAIELDPEDGRFSLGLAGSLSAQVMAAGSILAGAARVPRIKELLVESVELDPESVDARKALFQFYMFVPGFLGGGVDRAEEQAAALEELDRGEGLAARGQLEAKAERFPEAEAHYRKAVEEEPERGSAHRALAGFLSRRERHEEALVAYRECVRLEPDDPGSHEGLGGCLLAAGQLVEAEAELRRALELNPDSLPAQMQLAACLDERGDEAGARAAYRLLVERLGDSPFAKRAHEWLDEHPE